MDPTQPTMDPATSTSLLPPEDGLQAPSLYSLVRDLQQHAISQGYAIVIGRTKNNKKGEKRKAWLRCDRGGKPEKNSKSLDKRVTGSRLIDCPFKCTASLQLDKWVLSVEDGSHNHESTSAGSHPSHRQNAITLAVRNDIVSMTRAGSRPAQIITKLRLNDDAENPMIKSRDIYNIKAATRAKALGSLTPTQALLVLLHANNNWFVRVKKDSSTQRLEHMFFARKSSQELLKINYEVLILDATYKTNRYKLPLLVITGVTALNTSFYAAFAFMSSESTEDYLWVIEQLRELYQHLDIPDPSVLLTDCQLALIRACWTVFPKADALLCIWHIDKNVETHCRQYFDTMDDWEDFYTGWHRVMYAQTADEFMYEWDALQNVYNQEKPFAMTYLADKLITPLRHRFVSYWTNEHLHFGNRATSRGECQNGRLKKQLGGCSIGDLKAVVEAIDVLLMKEHGEYHIALGEAKMRLSKDLRRVPLFRDLFAKVAPFALRQMLPQYNLIEKQQMKPCTKAFTTTMGLPCAHKMEERMQEPGGVLRLEDIHTHWHLKVTDQSEDRDESLDDLLQVNEPNTIRPAGRPPGARNKRRRQRDPEASTTRDPSGFEYSRALFEQAMANNQQPINQEPSNESNEPSVNDQPSQRPQYDSHSQPQSAAPITAIGVAQQEEEATAIAFFGPLTTREQGRGRGSGGRGSGRGNAGSGSASRGSASRGSARRGRGLGHDISYARGNESQFGVIEL